MKKLGIKTKIILWYTVLMVALMVLVLFFLLSVANQTAAFNAKNTLMSVVEEMKDEVELEHGAVDVDHDFKTYEQGNVLLALYNGNVVAGQYPDGFPENTPLQAGQVYTIAVGNETFLVYDAIVEQTLYVRGIHPMSEGNATWNRVLLITLVAFPLFVLIAALGGYLIIRNAFRPVANIARTAGEIGGGNDLSKRIGTPDCGDEISALSRSFDEMLDRLERAFASEKQFTSDVSHELRTPLAVLKSQCEYALEQSDGGEVRHALEEMLGKIDRITTMVARLLELSRAERRTEALHFEPVDLSELLELVVEELADRAAEKSIAVRVESGGKITMNCEQTLIMRLMLNLIENAIKYTPAGGQVTAVLRAEPGAVRFSVVDNGIGIESVHLDKIFHRFYRVNTARTGEPGGSFGLGLSFCRWIVEAHGGHIAVESALGSGSTFIVTLPL